MANVVRAVRAKQNSAAIAAKRHDAFDAFFLEMLVAHGQGFVDDQHIGLHRRDQCKRQPHRHARRIGFDRPVQRLAQLAKLDDAGLQPRHFGMVDADQATAKIQVVAATEVGVKARAQLQNGRHAAHSLNAARAGLQGAGQQFEQRAFARAVVADHANALATLQLERHIAQRPVAAVAGVARDQGLEPLARRGIKFVFLAQPLHLEHGVSGVNCVVRHSQSTSWSRLRATTTLSASASPPSHSRPTNHTLAGGHAPCKSTCW